jgi:hypothetical protein
VTRYALALLLLLQGCCLSPGFVPAQRAFYDALAPEYRAYVESDPELTPNEKASRLDLLAAQEAVLQEAEAGK